MECSVWSAVCGVQCVYKFLNPAAIIQNAEICTVNYDKLKHFHI